MEQKPAFSEVQIDFMAEVMGLKRNDDARRRFNIHKPQHTDLVFKYIDYFKNYWP